MVFDVWCLTMFVRHDRLYNREPRREKTGLQGFRPGPTQTGLRNMARGLKFWIYEVEGFYYLYSGNRKADQRLCFRYTDSTIPRLPKYKISTL